MLQFLKTAPTQFYKPPKYPLLVTLFRLDKVMSFEITWSAA